MTQGTGPSPVPGPASARTSTIDLMDMLSAALQRSERLRLWVVAGLVALLSATIITQHLLGGAIMQGPMFAAMLTLAAIAMAIAAGGAALVARAERDGCLVPRWFWLMTVVLDASLPTAALGIAVAYSGLDPLRAVSTPAVVLYAVLAAASVLRLRPGLCVLGAVIVGVGHASLTAWALHVTPGPTRRSPSAYAYTVAVVLSWLVAAVVAREVRRHVISGLHEARVRAELSGVREKLDMARDIQAGLLPREPLRVARFEIAGFNRPADETGGDYYDWIPLSDGRVAVMIADVTGHGIGPAILMAVCRAYARATVPSLGGLSEMLGRLNTLVSDDFKEGRFVTLALALLDPRTGDVDLISAGHGPTLLFRGPTGTVESFSGDGPPLGVVPGVDFDQPTRLRMAPGDVLFLSTDGFMETGRADGAQYGTTALSESLRRHAGKPLEEIPRALDADREAFAAGEPQRDDVTAVLVRCTGAGMG